MLHRDPDDGSDVLAGRLAATLISHDPGWRLPRPSEIARRHNVTVGEVHAAIKELVGRNVIRQAPDGYLYLTSPAEYRVSLEGVSGLRAYADPMGGELTCISYGTSWQAASADAACALRIAPGKQVSVLRLAWALNDLPAAMSTTYMAADIVSHEALANSMAERAKRGDLPIPAQKPAPAADGHDFGTQWRRPQAVSVQMQLPSASAARRLRLNPGQMALILTMLSSDTPGRQPSALTITVLRPDLFRITLETPQSGLDGERLQAAQALAAADLPPACRTAGPGNSPQRNGPSVRGR